MAYVAEDTDHDAAPETVPDDAVGPLGQREGPGVEHEVTLPLVLTTNAEVDDVEDGTDAAGDDEQYTDESGLSLSVRMDDGSSLVRQADVQALSHWPTHASARYVNRLLTLPHRLFFYARATD